MERAAEEVKKILKGDATENNEHRKAQMLQLAAIQGTLKDDYCDNCGEKGHRVWACPNKRSTFKRADIKCAYCGDRSHPSFDCPVKKSRISFPLFVVKI